MALPGHALLNQSLAVSFLQPSSGCAGDCPFYESVLRHLRWPPAIWKALAGSEHIGSVTLQILALGDARADSNPSTSLWLLGTPSSEGSQLVLVPLAPLALEF